MSYDKCEDCSVDSHTERDVCRACQLDDARKTINDLKQQLQQAKKQAARECIEEAVLWIPSDAVAKYRRIMALKFGLEG